MYAAAGGASLASRQARQRQRQQKKTQQLQAKLHPPKPASVAGTPSDHGASTPTRSQSRQFHQLPTTYLRAPQAMGRKLSATYTTQSKLLLPIDEGDTQSVLQLRMHSHSHAHGGHAHGGLAAHHAHAHSHMHHSHLTPVAAPVQTPYQQFAASQGRASPKLLHRHSGSSAGFHPAAAAAAAQLHKSATATLPLVSQMEATPPTTPSAAVGVKTTATSLDTAPHITASTSAAAAAAADEELAGAAAMFVPHHDAIIVTPATPMASPGHVAKLRPSEDLPEGAPERQPLTAGDGYDDDEPMQPPTSPLERKCSVYRMRRSDAFEHIGDGVGGGLKRQLRELQFGSGAQQTQYEPLLTDEPQLVFKGLANGRKWQLCAYCEEGICVCEHIEKNTYVTTPPAPLPPPPPPAPVPECAQGRAAWLERGRRCSVQEQQQQQATCHRRWVKRNRIQDASLGGSSDDEDFLGVLRGPSTFANAFLYVGLGTVALGLVIAFVGTGEKGFKTVELRLIGPSLIGLGLICCILRILFCICPSHCISSSKKTRKKNGNKIDADHTTSLLRGESKRVSIARGPAVQSKYPITHKRSQSKMLNEGMEALRQIATTSLFMQNEQKTSMNRVVPIINEPESANVMDAPLEMKKLQKALNVCEMSDEEQAQQQAKPLRVAKCTTTTTTAVTSSTTKSTGKPITTATTTILSTVDEKPDSKLVRQRVTLQQQRQQQQQQQHLPKLSPTQSESLSSSSTVKDSLDGVVVEETSLMVQSIAEVSEAPRALPSSCSAGAIPRLKSNTTAPTQRPGVSTGATPKTTTSVPTSSSSGGVSNVTSGAISRLPTSLSHPTSYDLPPSQPHTYSAAATVRGPLGMSMAASSSVYAMPASRSMTTSSFATPSTTTISLLPLPAPPTTAAASLPGQILESTNTSLSNIKPAASTLMQLPAAPTLAQPLRPVSATASTYSSGTYVLPSTAATESRSQPSSASQRGSLLLAPPTTMPPASKFEPELVLSPAKLGQ